MKKLLSILSIALLGLVVAACGSNTAQQNTDNKVTAQTNTKNTATEATTEKSKAIVVYYSYSGNTENLAKQIHEQTGGDIAKIETVKAYPATYDEVTKQAKEELQAGFKPEIKPLDVNIQEYDTIYLGSPCWWGTIASPVITFLSQNDMSGKTIVLFMTHGGSGLGRSIEHLKELCPNATIKEGLSVRGSNVKDAQNDVKNWLAK